MTFRHIYICVLLNRSELIGTGSEISRFSVTSIWRDMFPNTYEEASAAANSATWHLAMESEMHSIRANKT